MIGSVSAGLRPAPQVSASAKPQIISPAQFAAGVAKGRVVVEFFSYGCGFCQRARPEVDKAAAALAGQAKVLMVSVDDPAGKAIGIRHGLSYYPTFAVFQDGKHVGTFTRQGAVDPTAKFIVDNINALYARAPRMQSGS